MAEDKEEAVEADTKPVESNTKLKLVIILSATIVFLAVIGMVTTIFIMKPSDDANSSQTAATENDKRSHDTSGNQIAKGTPHFYKFRPPFVVNIPTKGRVRFLQVEVEIMTHSEKIIESVENYAPLLKNDLVQLFSRQKFEDLNDPDGQEKLREKALEVVKTVIRENTGEDGVEQVLFTSFITQ